MAVLASVTAAALIHAGINPGVVSGKHQPCPWCGGEDRFRWIEKASSALCGQCGPHTGGALVARLLRIPMVQAHDLLSQGVGSVAVASRRMLTREWCDRNNAKILGKCFAIAEDTAAWRYLQQRIPGLKMEVIGPDLLFCPRLEWREHHGTNKAVLPAMVAVLRDHAGKVAALHRTYLTDDGFKADLPSLEIKKLTACPDDEVLNGQFIRLNPHAALTDWVCTAEGIEDGLAVVMSTGGVVAVDVLYSAGNLEKYTPIDGVQVVNYAQFDGLKPIRRNGVVSLERRGHVAASKLTKRLGRRVRHRFAPEGMDWADLWLATHGADSAVRYEPE
jgi:putative DNA primase/helicase